MSKKTPLQRIQESDKLLEKIMLVVPGFRATRSGSNAETRTRSSATFCTRSFKKLGTIFRTSTKLYQRANILRILSESII